MINYFKQLSLCFTLSFTLTLPASAAISPVNPGQAISAEQMNTLISELNLIKSRRHLVKSDQTATSWYEVYNDGWVRQGGRYNKGDLAVDWSATVALPVTMKDSAYTLITQAARADGQGGSINNQSFIIQTTTTNFTSRLYGDGRTQFVHWTVEGFGNSSSVQALGASPSY